MKKSLLYVLLVSIFCSCQDNWNNKDEDTSNYTPYQEMIKRYQDSTSFLFMSGMNDILPKEEISSSKYIPFFEPNEKYRVKAKFISIANGKKFQMATSTDRLPTYVPIGKFIFSIDEEELELTLYENEEHKGELFCPFKDLSNGKETYGGGRYLDFSWSDTLNPIIDFNYSYNPYCAYNKKYSCPIPPIENHLNVRIEAGVRKWH